MERFQILINYMGKDLNVLVDDIETAELFLNDNDYAESLLRKLNIDISSEVQDPIYISTTEVASVQAVNPKEQSEMDGPSSQNSLTRKEIIWCRKKPTNIDLEATSKLLKLRQEMASQFDDKRTVKSKLWNHIAVTLQSEFDLGDNGAEKCRQKFANLQRQYMAFIRQQKTTGTGKIDDVPPFFDEMHSILGGKDKVNPSHLDDSMEIEDTNNPKASTSSKAPLTMADDSQLHQDDNSSDKVHTDRFKNIKKKLKPSTTSELILKEIRADRAKQTEQFEFLKSHLKKSEDQKERFLNIIEKAFNRKRKREDDSDDE